jgi:sodium/bile acid cotransporter 7
MKAFFRKRWFLLLLLGGVGLAAYCPGGLRPWTRWLDLRAVVAPALFLMAWSLESRSLFQALIRPLPALWAVLISYGAVPVLAWSAGWLLPDADLRIGLLIIASAPCTLASAALWTRLAGGNEAMALLVILLTTATSWLATTGWLALVAGREITVDAAGMMRGLLLVLVVPVGLGQMSRAVPPLAQAADRHKPFLGVVSRLLIFLVIVKAVVDVGDKLEEKPSVLAVGFMAASGVLCLVTHLAALAGGFWSSRWLRFDRPSQIAVAFACSQKTLPVALYLFDAYFKESYPLAIVPMVFYHVGQLIVDTFIADGLARPQRSSAKPDFPSPSFAIEP